MGRERFKHKETPDFSEEEVAFDYPEHLNLGEARGVYTVFTPETEPRGDIVLSPGTGEFRSSFRAFVLEFVRKGFRVIVTEHPEPNTPPDSALEKELLRAKTNALSYWNRRGVSKDEVGTILDSIHLASFREAYNYMLSRADVHDRFGATKSISVGHSYGGFTRTIAQVLWPEQLYGDRLVLLNPAGLTGKIESPEKSLSASEKVRKDRKQKEVNEWGEHVQTSKTSLNYLFAVLQTLHPGIILDSLRYTRARSKWRLPLIGAFVPDAPIFKEAEGIAHTDLRPMLALLQKDSIDVTTVFDDDDPLFKAKKIEQNPPAGRLVRTKKYGHFGPITAPEKLAQEVLERVL